jgi:hypothetical protein
VLGQTKLWEEREVPESMQRNIQEAITEKDRTTDGVITRRDGTKRRVNPIKLNRSETMKQ